MLLARLLAVQRSDHRRRARCGVARVAIPEECSPENRLLAFFKGRLTHEACEVREGNWLGRIEYADDGIRCVARSSAADMRFQTQIITETIQNMNTPNNGFPYRGRYCRLRHASSLSTNRTTM